MIETKHEPTAQHTPPPLPNQRQHAAQKPQKKRGPVFIVVLCLGIFLFFGICFVGIVAAIAIPNIGKINEAAKEAKAQRDAQTLASVYSTALATGYDLASEDKQLMPTLRNIVKGTVVESGVFAGEYFGAPQFTEQDLQMASEFLKMDHGKLVYVYPPQSMRYEP